MLTPVSARPRSAFLLPGCAGGTALTVSTVTAAQALNLVLYHVAYRESHDHDQHRGDGDRSEVVGKPVHNGSSL